MKSRQKTVTVKFQHKTTAAGGYIKQTLKFLWFTKQCVSFQRYTACSICK